MQFETEKTVLARAQRERADLLKSFFSRPFVRKADRKGQF